MPILVEIKNKVRDMAISIRIIFAVILVAGSYAGSAPAMAQSEQSPDGEILVRYEPSPDNVVDGMLKLAQVGPRDFVIDLGSGDGRIVIAAVKNFGARALGVELNPDLIKLSLANAQAAGVADRAMFLQQDILKTDLTHATVITMFLFPHVNMMLRPILLGLKPGTRIVSHYHDMADWHPDQRQKLPTKEHYGDTWIFYWVVPAKVAGTWQWNEPRSGVVQRHVLTLRQTFQDIDGSLTTDSLRSIDIRDAKLNGSHLSFWVPIRDGANRTARWDFQGEADGGTIIGKESTTAATGRNEQLWRATRKP